MENNDQSIKTRLLVVGAVIALWAFSMFPLKNKDFFQYVKNQADSSIASKAVDADTLKTLDLAVEETYKTVQDKNVKATREAFKDAQMARAEVISKKEEEDFAAAFKQAEADYANKVKKEITDIAPMSRQAALLNAAEGKVTLFKFINTPGEFPTNKEVSKHIQKAVAGKIKYGIDLLGGVQFTMEFDPKDLEGKGENGEPLEAEATRDSIIEILRKRIDGKGLAEIEIRPFASTSILITVPNVNEEEVAVIRQLLLKQAKLEFRGLDPSGEEFPHVEAGRQPMRLGDVEMGGENIENAFATKDENGRWVVAKTFNSQGAVDFGEVTSEYVGKRLAIVLDGKIYSAPTIQSVITKNGQISGDFTKEAAEELALVLRSGAMPVELKFAGESRTDASLGAASIKSGVMSCLTGLILVLIFMAFYYRKPGFIAVLALVVNILLVIGSMAILGGTFTLPGIAGIILTIGMAVDTNVLIFERIREELASGKTLYNSTREGFSRAFVTIFDANITPLLTAIILMKFGSG
ncbi:MAG: protein translocase subunit SecD, partial [Lentisphaeraceae bacterium]|nr:protein translocase subunit SecD [Lentisphaeraceae bacterium]